MSRARNFDFYSPFMAAWIVQNPDDPNGVRFPLWIEGVSPDRKSSLIPRNPDGTLSDVSGDIDELNSLAFCTEITVELQLAYIPKITATLSPPFREARAFLNSSLIEWGNSVLEVQFGYTGGTSDDIVLSTIFSGVLLKPEVTLGSDISIVLNAQGIGGYMAQRQDAVITYQNKSRRDIISDLAQYIGLQANFDDVDEAITKQAQVSQDVFVRLGTPQLALQAIEDVRKQIAQKSPIGQTVSISGGGLTVWRLLYQVVREAQCWMYIQGPERPGDPEQLRITLRNSVMTGKPKYTFILYDYLDGQVGPANDTYPILSVASPTSAVYLPSSTRGFLVFGFDSKERVKVTEEIKSNSPDTARSGNSQTQANTSKQNPAAAPDKAQGMGIASSDSHSPEYKEQIKAEKEAAATAMGVQLNIGSLGIPDILPAEVAAVRGIGSRFEGGNYGIFKVVHKMGTSGYTTDLELRSNVGQLASAFEKATLPAGEVNDKSPATGDDSPGNLRKAKPAK